MTIFEEQWAIVFLLFCSLKIQKQGIELQIFSCEQVVEILKNGHNPIQVTTPPGIFVCIQDLGRHAKSLDLKISVLFVCKGGHVSCWDMQNNT